MERERLVVALGPDDIFHGYIQIAAAQGLLDQHGLDVQLLFMSSGEQAAQAVIQGKCLVGIHGFDQVLMARERGEPLAAIGKAMKGPGFQLAAQDRAVMEAWANPKLSGAKKFSLMKGKRIGIAAADMLQSPWVLWMAGQAGLTPAADVQMVDVGAAEDGMAALAAGGVDILVTRPPAGEMIQRKGAGRILWFEWDTVREPLPLYLVVSALEESWESRPEALRKFIQALRVSFVLMRRQQDTTLTTARRLWRGVPEDAVRMAVAGTLRLLPDDMALKKDEAGITARWLLDGGHLSREIPFEEACTNRFVE